MAHRKDILDINPIMSIKNDEEGWNPEGRVWVDKFHATVAAVNGNKIGLNFKRVGIHEIAKDKWMNGRCMVNSSDYKITGHASYISLQGLRVPIFWLDLLETPDVSVGDAVVLLWDCSRLPNEWWDAGQDIFRNGIPAAEPGSKQIPAYFTGTFHQCGMDNNELHAGCQTEDGDGLSYPIKHHKEMNDGERWIVEKSSGYSTPISPINENTFTSLGLSTDPADISVSKLSKPIIHLAAEALEQAKKDNIETVDVAGQTLTNPDYEAV